MEQSALRKLGIKQGPRGFLLDKTLDGVRYRADLGPHEARALAKIDRFYMCPEEFMAAVKSSCRGNRRMSRLVREYLHESRAVRRNSASHHQNQRITLERMLPYGPEDAAGWRLLHASRYLEHRTAGGIAVNSVCTETAIMKSFWRWVVKRELLLRSPIEDLVAPRPMRRMKNRTQRIDAKDLARLKGEVSDVVYAALIVLWACGLRSSEVARITERDIDEERMRLWVKNHKGRRGHSAPIPDHTTLSALYVVMAQLVKDKGCVGARVAKQLDRAIARLNMKRFTPHDLRHACLTRWAEEGISPLTIQKWAGHSSMKITMEYFHAFKADNVQPEPTGL